MLNLKPLWNYEIDEQLNDISSFYKTIPKNFLDSLNIKSNENFCCVLNTEVSNNNGKHWVCLYNDKNTNFIEYFDSFGVPPLKNVVDFCKRNYPKKEIFYNDNQLQKYESVLCGYYCIYYIRNRNKGLSPYEVVYNLQQEPSDFNEVEVVTNY